MNMHTNCNAIVGMSPGNSYFKQPIIHRLLEYTASRFVRTRICIPDLPAEHTYKALGYSEQKSQQRARQKSNVLRNHSKKSIEQIRTTSPDADLRIIDWNSEIEPVEQYQRQLKYVYTLYENSSQFYSEVREDTKRVIESYPYHRQAATDQAVDEGIHYVLKEMAFLDASCAILQSQASVFVYHRSWPVFENYFKGVYDGIVRDMGLFLVSFD